MSVYKTYGEEIFTADASSSLRVFASGSFDQNFILTIIEAWFIGYNAPTYTSIYMQIYSYDTTLQSPVKLIATSTNTVLAADITAQNSFFKGPPFTFDNIPMKAGTEYAFVPRINGYTYTSGSHIAFAKDFPDPVYTTGVTVNYPGNVGRAPFALRFIGANF